jgi:hypothetical protein
MWWFAGWSKEEANFLPLKVESPGGMNWVEGVVVFVEVFG